MGTLRRLRDATKIPLGALTVLGRSPACTHTIEGTYVSSEHARISWTGESWVVRDLGSRNGTFIGNERLDPGASKAVLQGAELGFGDPGDLWRLDDATAPGPMAFPLGSGEVIRAAGEVLTLPDEIAPELSIYPNPNGSGWLMERSKGTAVAVAAGDSVTACGQQWRLDLPVIDEGTPIADTQLTLDTVSVRFAVSRDEERVEIALIQRGLETCLESREHNYLLLTLARLRREDQDLPEPDRGWRSVDELADLLKMDPNWVYVATHRARQRFAAAGLQGAAGIVQVERGRRRLGVGRFEIIPLVE